jgi:hypothetical protein
VTEKSSVKRCYVCGSDQHLSRYHDNKSDKSEGKPARVYSCAEGRNDGAESQPGVTNAAAPSAEVPVTSPASSQSDKNAACREVAVETLVSRDVNAVVSPVSSDVGQCPDSLAPLDYIDVNLIDGYKSLIAPGLCDSDAQMSVIRSDVAADLDLPSVGKMRIRGILRPVVEADLVHVNMCLASCNECCGFISARCAVAPGINDSFLLSTDVINSLLLHSCCA